VRHPGASGRCWSHAHLLVWKGGHAYLHCCRALPLLLLLLLLLLLQLLLQLLQFFLRLLLF